MICLSRQRENNDFFFLEISKVFSMVYHSILVAMLERDELDGWATSVENWCLRLEAQCFVVQRPTVSIG